MGVIEREEVGEGGGGKLQKLKEEGKLKLSSLDKPDLRNIQLGIK